MLIFISNITKLLLLTQIISNAFYYFGRRVDLSLHQSLVQTYKNRCPKCVLDRKCGRFSEGIDFRRQNPTSMDVNPRTGKKYL